MDFFVHHQVFCTLAAYILFSSTVSGMPSPAATSGLGYRWLFNSLHALAGNIGRIPQVRNFFGDTNGAPAPPAQKS